MQVEPTAIPDLLLIKPKVFGDSRGYFQETYEVERYAQHGIGPFVQDNLSRSAYGVLRGLHYQYPHPQGKLVYVIEGEVWDVAVDVRRGSPTFGQSVGALLSADNHHQLWLPEGFAHGFSVLSEHAIFAYKCTAPYHPEYEHSIRYDDPALHIDWHLTKPLLSTKDQQAPLLADVPITKLPE
ncbi:MAG: dTDP-4-dehydrorhamnose 3,5-epimerase [Pseudomonadales bacterium]